MNEAMNVGDITQVAIIEIWQWWQKALKNPAAVGSAELPVHPGEFECGYYRTRFKNGPWEPVGIYPDDDGRVIAFRGDKPVSDIPQLFEWCCRNPVTFDAYVAATEGKGWEDEPPPPSIGDNSGETDPFKALEIEFAGERELAEEFLKKPVTSQAQADKVAVWAKRLTAIKKRAETEHEIEKRPHLEAGRAVDEKWRPLKTEPDDLAKKLKAHTLPFLNEQKRLEEERQRKAREEAEAARRAAAEAARRAQESDQPSEVEQQARRAALAEAERQAAMARAAEAEAEARKIGAGRTGARVSIRVEKVGVVTDYAKAAAALAAMKHKDFVECIDMLANRAAKAGLPFDGMEIQEREKVV